MSSLPAPRYFDRRTPPHVTTLVFMAGTGAMAMNIFLASLPEMARYYDRSYPVMQIALTGFLMLTSVCQLIIGPVSDRYGRRPVIIGALIIFILASIGAANSTVFEVFMFFRLVQAVIVAGMVISRASVRDMVARERAASMLGYIAMGMALAPMMAPALGGFLADMYGWQSNFHALTLIGLFVLVVVFFDQGETNQHRSSSFAEQFKA